MKPPPQSTAAQDLHKAGNTLAQLPADDPDYLLNVVSLKPAYSLSLNRF
jgi:hypothetical protein